MKILLCKYSDKSLVKDSDADVLSLYYGENKSSDCPSNFFGGTENTTLLKALKTSSLSLRYDNTLF